MCAMSMMMKVLIVDDEPLARARLRDMLRSNDDVHVVGEAVDGESALALCASLQPDVVLLDIQMPGIDGVETARRLASHPRKPAVIFCTAHDSHALSAFEADAVGYIVKPVRAERLTAALSQAAALVAGRQRDATTGNAPRNQLCARLGGNLRLIPLDEVYYLQAEEKYVVVHHARGTDLIEESLKSLEAEFPQRLLRIHRNCLVMRSEVAGLRRTAEGQTQVMLKHNGQALDVSRRNLSYVKDNLRHL